MCSCWLCLLIQVKLQIKEIYSSCKMKGGKALALEKVIWYLPMEVNENFDTVVAQRRMEIFKVFGKFKIERWHFRLTWWKVRVILFKAIMKRVLLVELEFVWLNIQEYVHTHILAMVAFKTLRTSQKSARHMPGAPHFCAIFLF